MLIFASIMFYSTLFYGIIYDHAVIESIFETDSAEALSYLNITFVLFVFLTALIPMILLLKTRICYTPFLCEVIQRIKLLFITVITMIIIAFFFYADYSSVGRNNRELTSYLIPFNGLVNTYKYIDDEYFHTSTPFIIIDENPTLINDNNQHKQVVVMVVGETARAQNSAYYGYPHNTNPYTPSFQPVFFHHVTSCGTATAISVPCMFSVMNREHYDKQQAKHQQNLLDIADKAGVDVLWLDNNSSCKGVCARVKSISTDKNASQPLCDGDYCYDEVLLEPLNEKLAHLTKQTTVIFLHIIGSHGPTYYRRYPKNFAVFTPDCPQSDIQNCSHQQLVNSYDNTLVYTDYVISKVMETLQQLHHKLGVNTQLLYISDHGESLGENGLYLHGFPFALAPKEQISVPMLYWQSTTQGVDQRCLAQNNKKTYSQDNIYHSLLGLLKIKSVTYRKEMDIFSSCTH